MASVISPAKPSSSSSPPSKLEQRKKFFKKKMVGPAKKRVLSRQPMILAGKTTSSPKKSGYKKTFKEDISNTRMLPQCGSSGNGEVKSLAMVRAIEVPSQLSGSSGHKEVNSLAMVRAVEVPSILSGSPGHGEIKSPAMDRAQEVQAKLPPEFPSFVKYMLKSHVTGGFWLGLTKSFCDMHLPKQDVTILLADEGVEEYKTNYLSEKRGLSAGWRGFSLAHNLVEGDVLVFQLIESLKFKVYIVRANQTAETNGAVSLPNSLEITHCENEFEDVKNVEMIVGEDKRVVHEMGSRRKDGRVTKRRKALDFAPVVEDTEPVTEDTTLALDSEPVVEGTRLAKSILVKGFDNFSIIVDGLAIETDIPMNLRYTYYILCINQKSFLHSDLIKGLNSKLAAGIITETMTIAVAIKPSRLTVSLERLQSWDRTLKAFEDMGMKVGFLRARIKKLECLLYEQVEIIRSKKVEQTQFEDEIRDLESKQLKRYEAKIALDSEIEALLVKNSSLEVTLKNIAAAAW